MAKQDDLVTKLYLDKRLKQQKDDIVEEIVKEIKDMREEFNVHQFSHTRINDDLSELDDRVTKIEKTAKAD